MKVLIAVLILLSFCNFNFEIGSKEFSTTGWPFGIAAFILFLVNF